MQPAIIIGVSQNRKSHQRKKDIRSRETYGRLLDDTKTGRGLVIVYAYIFFTLFAALDICFITLLFYQIWLGTDWAGLKNTMTLSIQFEGSENLRSTR